MITRERLEELIEQGKTIWRKNNKVIGKIVLANKQYEFSKNGCLCLLLRDYDVWGFYSFETLFETKKQAEWALKYHATRTEELDLPVWEEIEKIKEKDVYIIAKPREMRFYIDYKFLIPQIKLCTLEDVFNWNLDEKGYLSACDLCLKLFKGEE